MPGELVPLVMLPRYTTLTGATIFTTIAMDVTEYSSAILNIWRGRLVNLGGIKFNLQESTDQETWTACAGTTVDYDPGQETEGQQTATLKKRWFRLSVGLTGTDPQATVWAVGFLEQREA
jgi:hypothetical protein